MNKTVLFFAFALVCTLSTSMVPSNLLIPTAHTTFSDLSVEDKKEAIAHMLSSSDCSWNGIELYGQVEFVSSYPDIKIQYVSSYGDIKVQMVDSYPDACGKWQKVSSYGDFKVQIVDSYPDIKVQLVDSYPGVD